MIIPLINTPKNEQENLNFLGFLGIFKESIKLIFRWPKIFFQITLFFILPHICIFALFDNRASIAPPHFSKTHNNISTIIHNEQETSPSYKNLLGSIILDKDVIKSLVLWIISIILSFMTVSSIIYTVANIYENEKNSFKKVLSVLPKVWKPYMITYLSCLCVILSYAIILFIWASIFLKTHNQFLFMGGLLLFVMGIVYLSIIWQFSYAISVLERIRGFKALKRSKEIIKGKLGTALGVFLVLILLEMPIIASQIYDQLVGGGVQMTIWFKVFKVVWSTMTTLLACVSQVVFYFVCKSYHHQENIDKEASLLKDDHLKLYIGEYGALKEEVI